MQEMFEITIDLEKATPKEYADLINENYKKALEKGLSRFDIAWVSFSFDVNRIVRKRRETEPTFVDVFAYWLNKSELLELEYQKPFLLYFKREKYKKVIKMLRRRINNNGNL